MRLHLVLASTLVALFASAAHAQEPKLALTMGYPSSIGVLWQASNRIAIRPETTFSKGSNDSSSTNSIAGTTTSSPSDGWAVGVGVSALFYLTRVDALRTYVTPRFAYSKTSSSTNLPGNLATSSTDLSSYTTSASFGAQYALGRHFGVLGEIGVSYATTTTRSSVVETITTFVVNGPGAPTTRTDTTTVSSELHARNFGSRSGVGVIFYF